MKLTMRIQGERHTREPQCLDPKTRHLVVSCWKRVSEENGGNKVTEMGMGGSYENFGFCVICFIFEASLWLLSNLWGDKDGRIVSS